MLPRSRQARRQARVNPRVRSGAGVDYLKMGQFCLMLVAIIECVAVAQLLEARDDHLRLLDERSVHEVEGTEAKRLFACHCLLGG